MTSKQSKGKAPERRFRSPLPVPDSDRHRRNRDAGSSGQPYDQWEGSTTTSKQWKGKEPERRSRSPLTGFDSDRHRRSGDADSSDQAYDQWEDINDFPQEDDQQQEYASPYDSEPDGIDDFDSEALPAGLSPLDLNTLLQEHKQKRKSERQEGGDKGKAAEKKGKEKQ